MYFYALHSVLTHCVTPRGRKKNRSTCDRPGMDAPAMDAPAKKRKTMPAMSTGPTPAAAWHMLQADARAMAEVYGKGDNDGTEPLPLSSALRQV